MFVGLVAGTTRPLQLPAVAPGVSSFLRLKIRLPAGGALKNEHGTYIRKYVIYLRPPFEADLEEKMAFKMSTAVATALLATGLALFSGSAANANEEDIDKLRSAMEKYKDPVAAVHDGYFSTLGCVLYESGTMGVHFINPALISPVPDPLNPTLLVYEPNGDKLELVAVEWLIPLATGIKEKPSLFGHPFDGPMEGHEPLLPRGLHHYDLHAWIFKDNPLGMFHPVNPDVKCPEGPYTFLEEPPATVPNPN